MLFFSSLSGRQYAYDPVTNKILLIPDYWIDKLKKGDEKELIEHLLQAGIIHKHGWKFIGPDKDWYKNNEIGTLILNITDACNLRCVYCAYSGHYPFERSHGKSVMHIDIAKKAIDYYIEKSTKQQIRRISIYGGEPFLCRQRIKEIITYAKKRANNFVFSISTNAVLMKKSWIEYLIQEKIDLYISLDGDQFTHDRYRIDKAGRGTHSRIMHNLQHIYELSPEYYEKHIFFLATLAPPYKLLSLYNFQKDNYLLCNQPWFVNFVSLMDTTFFESINTKSHPSYNEQLEIIVKDYVESAVNGNIKSHFGYWLFRDYLQRIHTRSMNPTNKVWINGCCTPGVDKLFVDTNGQLFPCERCGNFMNLGNVTQGLSYDKVAKIVSLYINDCQKNCIDCPNIRFCDTCYLAARRNNQIDLSRKYEYCDKRIDKLSLGLRVYTSILEKKPDAFDELDLDGWGN
jgi:uncharacterized protein